MDVVFATRKGEKTLVSDVVHSCQMFRKCECASPVFSLGFFRGSSSYLSSLISSSFQSGNRGRETDLDAYTHYPYRFPHEFIASTWAIIGKHTLEAARSAIVAGDSTVVIEAVLVLAM